MSTEFFSLGKKENWTDRRSTDRPSVWFSRRWDDGFPPTDSSASDTPVKISRTLLYHLVISIYYSDKTHLDRPNQVSRFRLLLLFIFYYEETKLRAQKTERLCNHYRFRQSPSTVSVLKLFAGFWKKATITPFHLRGGRREKKKKKKRERRSPGVVSDA